MANPLAERHNSLRILFSAACAIIVIAALRVAENFIVPVLVAFFLAQLSLPVMRALRRRRVPLTLAVVLTVLADITVIVAIVVICINLMNDFKPNVGEYLSQLRGLALRWGEELEARKVEDATTILTGIFTPQLDSVWRVVNQTNLLGLLASLLTTAFFVLILMVFMLIEGGGIGGRMAVIQRLRGPNFAHLRKVSQDIQKYLGIKTLVSAATGTLAGLLTWAIGLDFPVLWGMVAFVLNFIPAIGSVIAAIPPMLVALVTGDTLWPAFFVLLGYVAINIAFGNIIEPMLLGRRFGISTLVVLISVLFWGWLWGPIGMFLAVPLTMLVKVIFDNTSEFRWLSVVLGKGMTLEEARRKKGGPSPGHDDASFADPDLAGDVVPSLHEERQHSTP